MYTKRERRGIKMKNYEELLKHARETQMAQSKLGQPAKEESKFIDCVQTMDILEKREKTNLEGAYVSTLVTEAIATGALSLGTAATTGSLGSALGVFTLGLATMGATSTYKAIKDYLISKKYQKERNGLASQYQAYLDSREEPDFTK